MKIVTIKTKHKKKDEPGEIVCSSNDGKQWRRGRMIGKGSFSSVFMAFQPESESSNFPSIMAVKCADYNNSETLVNEKLAYDNLAGCSSLIQCFRTEITGPKSGVVNYNLLLEFAAGGTLAEHIKKSNGKGLLEKTVRRYTRSILLGLVHMHKLKYFHCDLKPHNILLVRNKNSTDNLFEAKIGDLGLAKRVSRFQKNDSVSGTLLYLAPESLYHKEQKSPSDIWALGCIVLEMLTGNCSWKRNIFDSNWKERYRNLSFEEFELPTIPNKVSKKGEEFLKRCFVRNPRYRATAKELLDLPFVAELKEKEEEEKEKGGWRRLKIWRCLTHGDDNDKESSVSAGMVISVSNIIGGKPFTTTFTFFTLIRILLLW